jgi:hypothetical protein
MCAPSAAQLRAVSRATGSKSAVRWGVKNGSSICR